MSAKATDRPEWKRLAARVDEVLTYVWDPIEVRLEPALRCEYDTYVLRVTERLMRGTGAAELAELLARWARDELGRSDSPLGAENDHSTAELLIRWRELLGADRT
ncbi:MAG: hypothetical protein ACYS26_13840 [Planctomycetota bacterium]|jgi:hypothetical protein